MSGPAEQAPVLAGPRHDAIRSPRAWALLLSVTALGVATDLFSKWLAFATIADGPARFTRQDVLRVAASGEELRTLIRGNHEVVVVPHLLNLTLVLNPGAVFGIGAGHRWFFVAFTVAALGLAVWMFGAWTRSRDRAAHIAIALLLAGGLGNLYDRLLFACVRDFIHPLPGVDLPFGWRMPLSGGREVWPYVSNLADLWLLIGIAMLMWFLWRGGRRPAARPGATVEPSSAQPC